MSSTRATSTETNTYWDIETCQTTEGDKEQPALPRDALDRERPRGAASAWERTGLRRPAALQHARSDRPRRVPRSPDDGEADDRRPRPPEPGGARRADRPHRGQADYSGVVSSHSWSNEKDYPRIYRLGRRRRPVGQLDHGFAKDWKRLRGQRDRPYLLRARVRRRHERLQRVRRAARRRGSDRLPLQVVRRRGDHLQAAERRAHVRHQRGRHRPLRPLPRLGRGAAPARRRRDRRRHGERRRGVPADVGARRRRARAALPLAHEQPAPRGRALHRARPPTPDASCAGRDSRSSATAASGAGA